MPGCRDPSRRRDLLVGLAVVLPIALVGAIVYWAASAARGVALHVVGLWAALGLRGTVAAVGLLAGVAVAVPLVLVGVGVAVRHRFGHRVVAAVDRTLGDLPAIGPIYSGLRRSRDAIAGEGEAFTEVVRVEIADGVHALAFLVDRPGSTSAAAGGSDTVRTEDAAGEPPTVGDALEDGSATDDLVTVFLPFAPNPAVGGHLLGVREDRVEPTDVSVAEGLGILVGLGPHTATTGADHPLGSFYTLGGSGDREDATGENGDAPADGAAAN